MYDSWGEWWREFLWRGDGSTATRRDNIKDFDETSLDELDRELLNRDEATDLRNFNHILNVVQNVLRVSEEDVKKQMEHSSTEQKVGYDALLYGTLLKMNTQRAEVIKNPDNPNAELNEEDGFIGTGLRKDIYIRWDLICQMWNKLCIPQTKAKIM